MSALPYMPLYVADYLADAAHLTTEEHGAYLLLIMTYWQRGKALPYDPERLARIARLPNERWTDVERTLNDFFTVDGGHWHHKRIDAELAKVRDKSDKAKRAGIASASARKPTDVERTLNRRSTDVQQTFNHTDTDTDTDTKGRQEARMASPDLESKLREAAGWQNQPHPGLFVTGCIEALIANGASLEQDVLPVIRGRAPSAKPVGWKYFVGPIQDAMQSRLDAGTGPPRAGEVVPFANSTRSHHAPRPNTIAAGFDLIERAIEREERALAEAEGRDGNGQGDPLALP